MIEVVRELYLDLLARCVTNTVYSDPPMPRLGAATYSDVDRLIGRDWPSVAHTMIGRIRVENLRNLIEELIVDEVQGDLMETGVWRGGACIFMRGVLKAYGVTDRTVWLADSFQGLPPPDPERYPADAGDIHHTLDELRISLETVKSNFRKYDLLDDQVRFLPGFFADTLATAPVSQLALLRLDGDMYSSTMDALEALYHKVSAGGVVIVDEYHWPACRQAVDDFRARVTSLEPMVKIDEAAVYWRKGVNASR